MWANIAMQVLQVLQMSLCVVYLKKLHLLCKNNVHFLIKVNINFYYD